MHLSIVSAFFMLLIGSIGQCHGQGQETSSVLDTASIVNKKIDRSIDLSTQLVKLTERIIFENVGKEKVSSYFVSLSHKQAERLANFEATINNVPLKIHSNQQGPALGANGLVMQLYEIELGESNALAAGEFNKQPLVLTLVFSRLLRPYPAEIAQNERQFVKYEGYQTVVTPYLTRTQTTKIKLPDGARLESFSKAVKQSTGNGRLTYGPFTDVESTLTSKTKPELLTIHYENNTPFIAITHLERSIEVSHWANKLTVGNKINLAHIGAKLKGQFSRFDYQHDHQSGINSVRYFLTRLPSSAHNIYYRDAIGNISTSDVRKTQTAILANIRPRFPLFGGWVTNFILGYNLPASEFLSIQTKKEEDKNNKDVVVVGGDKYRLKFKIADQFYDNIIIDEVICKVILPEGANDIKIDAPFDIERLSNEIKYSYLDTIGRPVIVLRKENIVDSHIGKDIYIYYNYDRIYMLQEPLLLIGGVFLLCLFAALFSRMSFSMGSKSSRLLSTNVITSKHKSH